MFIFDDLTGFSDSLEHVFDSFNGVRMVVYLVREYALADIATILLHGCQNPLRHRGKLVFDLPVPGVLVARKVFLGDELVRE